MRDLKTRSALNVPAPPWGLAVTSILSVQLGSALSVDLIETVGPPGTAWLRLSMGAIILLAIARPPLCSVPPGRCAAATRSRHHHGAGDDRVPRRNRAHSARHRRRDRVPGTPDGGRGAQPQQEGAHLAGRGTAGSSRAVIRVPGRPRIDS